MIFSGFVKYWRNILDIVLIVGGIVFLFLWNPFNIFGGGAKLQNTANMIGQIKEIGQLITAEYYGEVITTYHDAKLDLLTDESGEREDKAIDLYIDLKKMIYEDYRSELDALEEIDGKKDRRKFAKEIDDNAISPAKKYLETYYFGNELNLGDNLLMFLKKDEFNERFRERDFDPKKKPSETRKWERFRTEQLNNIFNGIKNVVKTNNPQRVQDHLNSGFTTSKSFTRFEEDYGIGGLERKDRKTELALIGRGSVKAGFDFGKLDEGNVVYDEVNQVVHFFGFNATILNADINPWFIPQRRVPGFDILSDKKANFDKLKETKIHAVDKLEQKAREAGIVNTAQENGEEALRSFFALLTGDDIKEVIFHRGALLYEAESILEGDSTISLDELFTIDKLVNKNLEAIRSEKNSAIRLRREELLKGFLATLQNDVDIVAWNDSIDRLPFNYYNRYIPMILVDSVITEDERNTLASLRYDFVYTEEGRSKFKPMDKSRNEFYWLKNELSFIHQYNEFLRLLEKNLREINDNKHLTGKSLEYLLITDLPTDTIVAGKMRDTDLVRRLQKTKADINGLVHNRANDDSMEYVVRSPIGIVKYPVTNAFANVAPVGEEGFVLSAWKTQTYDPKRKDSVENVLKSRVKENLKKQIAYSYQFVGEDEYLEKTVPLSEHELLNLVRGDEFNGIDTATLTNGIVPGFDYTLFTYDMTSKVLSSSFDLDQALFVWESVPLDFEVKELKVSVLPGEDSLSVNGSKYVMADDLRINVNDEVSFRLKGAMTAWKNNQKLELSKPVDKKATSTQKQKAKQNLELLRNTLHIRFISQTDRVPNCKTTSEILALRSYMFEQNYKSFDIGPVTRARNWVKSKVFGEKTASEIREAIESESENFRKTFRSLRQ